MKKICFLFLILFFTDIVSAQNNYTIFVDSANTSGIENGSLSYPFNTIQEGINAAVDGDTILISPGRYIENIKFDKKNNLVIASHFITTGDTSYISNTMIDGNFAGTVIHPYECDSLSIIGLSIVNGYGTSFDNPGGGIFHHGNNDYLYVKNVIFMHNKAHSLSEGNSVYHACCENMNSVFEDCIFKNNTAANSNRSILGAGTTTKIINCLFHNNSNGPAIGAGNKLEVINSIFTNNSTTGNANSIFGWQAEIKIYNCIFSNNSNTPAVNFGSCTGDIINSNFTGNQRAFDLDSNIRVSNCIVWNNIDNNNFDGYNIQYSLIEGGTTGMGNISGNPFFNNPSASDFRLRRNSPCIDAGMPDTNGLQVPQTDILGSPRIVNNRIDIGAYESTIPIVEDKVLCKNAVNPFLYVPGSNIKWYSDENLNFLLHEGDTLFIDLSNYPYTYGHYYVTQTINQIVSFPGEIEFHIVPAPDTPTIVLKGETILICPDSGFYSYNWYFNNSPMVEEHKQFLEIQSNYQGYYHVEVATENQCKTKSDPYSISKKSGKNNTFEESVSIFPNPNNGVFTLNIIHDKEGPVNIGLTDLAGRTMENFSISKSDHQLIQEINVKHILKGLYLLIVYFDNTTYNQMIIIR